MTRFLVSFLTCITIISAAARAEAQPRVNEVRFGLSGTQRYSSGELGTDGLSDGTGLATYVGYRRFWDSGHGVVTDFTYRFDTTEDIVCIFECRDTMNIGVGYVGYGYRFIFPMKKTTRAISLTPNAGFVVGWAASTVTDFADSPVLGGRVALDADFFFRRFFFGMGLAYEIVGHTKGPAKVSHQVDFGPIPVFRLGVTFGDRSQPGT